MSSAYTSAVRKVALVVPFSVAAAVAASIAAGAASMPSTSPGATRAAKSTVIVPGPQPTSRSETPGARWGSRYAAEFSTVRRPAADGDTFEEKTIETHFATQPAKRLYAD